MKGRLTDGKVIALRAIVTAVSISAFLFMLVLSAAPQLHERIHDGGDAPHQCAVTLLAGGNCEQTPCHTIANPPPPPKTPSLLVDRHSHFVSAYLDFSLLEHAPPTTS